ncbi:hypothetical protein [Microbispora sp. H10885]|uniref:hypothetical protein n=1 Tax=Microbispora sp. H10885 TaxID=2729110 RepID=UPI00217572E6|nr:hypothetical protein [Microbispora sp. H10885]
MEAVRLAVGGHHLLSARIYLPDEPGDEVIAVTRAGQCVTYVRTWRSWPVWST